MGQVTRTNQGLTSQKVFDFAAILKMPTTSPITLVTPAANKIVLPTLITVELKWVADFTNITDVNQDIEFGWPAGTGVYTRIAENGVLALGANGIGFQASGLGSIDNDPVSNFLGPLALYITNTGNFTGGAAGSQFIVTTFYNLLSV